MVKGVQSTACLSLSGWLLLTHIQAVGITGNLLLLVYWVLKLPALGETLATLAMQYPTQRNITVRLLEPIKAREETAITAKLNIVPATITTNKTTKKTTTKQRPHLVKRTTGVAIDIQGTNVVAAGHTVLSDIHLNIEPGEHIAVVGPSGAGKSSLLGLLLGWHQAVGGPVFVDSEPLEGERILQLRRDTAWVDPAIQIWNRSLLENLRYSPGAGPYPDLGHILENANLTQMLARLPDGLQNALGEGGARLSGGEGQRVRLGRALWQQGVRLALLDEPFRGLDREQRSRHLAEARRFWHKATLVCVTHDVAETRSFSRVVIIENGQIVEDGCPEELAAAAGSRYHALLAMEESLRDELWGGSIWHRIRIEGGELHEAPRVYLTGKSAVRHE
jgi:ATP-binding cassette subfamily B protein